MTYIFYSYEGKSGDQHQAFLIEELECLSLK